MSEATMTISDWEARALKAESEVARLKAEARILRGEISGLKDRLGEYEDDDDDIPTPLDADDARWLAKKRDFLLSLSGLLLVTGGDRDYLELLNCSLATWEDEELVEALFEGREREARLRGEPWTWEEAA